MSDFDIKRALEALANNAPDSRLVRSRLEQGIRARRKRSMWSVAALAVATVSVGVIALAPPDDTSSIRVTRSPSAVATPSSTATTPPTPAVTSSPSHSVAASVRAAPTPSRSASPARPDDKPRTGARLTIDASPRSPTAGEPVTITVRMHAPNGGMLASWNVDFGDKSSRSGSPAISCTGRDQHPRSEPPRNHVLTYSHKYANPGIYTIRASVRTGGCGVFPDSATGSHTVRVVPAAPSPSPSPVVSPSATPSPDPPQRHADFLNQRVRIGAKASKQMDDRHLGVACQSRRPSPDVHS